MIKRRVLINNVMIVPDLPGFWATKFALGFILIENGKIINGGYGEYQDKTPDLIIDGQELYCAPGIFEPQANGFFDIDFLKASPKQICQAVLAMTEYGVTSVLPTITTESPEVMLGAVKNISEAMKDERAGPIIIGIHTEGPLYFYKI